MVHLTSEILASSSVPNDSGGLSIVIATNSYFPADLDGGPPYSNRELAESLARAGAKVTVVTTDRNGRQRLAVPKDRWVDVDGVAVFYATTRAGSWLHSRSYWRAIHEVMGKGDICIMSAVFWNFTGLAAWLACRMSGRPFVSFARGLLGRWALSHKAPKKRIYWMLLAKRIVNDSAAVIALAQSEARDLASSNIRPPVVIIPNGAPRIPSDEEITTHSKLLNRLAERPYIAFLGRVHGIKGVDLLIPAFERCAAAGMGVRLVIAGAIDPGYAATFARLLESCAHRDQIDVVGSVTGPAKFKLLEHAAAFVLSSYGEGLPVAVLEAMSVGTPVIVTKHCNLPEVSQFRAGIEVETSVDAVAAALTRILTDRQLHAELSANASRLVRERFSWDAVGTRVLRLCSDVLADRGQHAS